MPTNIRYRYAIFLLSQSLNMSDHKGETGIGFRNQHVFCCRVNWSQSKKLVSFPSWSHRDCYCCNVNIWIQMHGFLESVPQTLDASAPTMNVPPLASEPERTGITKGQIQNVVPRWHPETPFNHTGIINALFLLSCFHKLQMQGRWPETGKPHVKKQHGSEVSCLLS